MIRFAVDDPVFKTQPLFVLGCSIAKLDTFLRTFGCRANGDQGQVGQMFTFEQPPWRVVWVRDLPRTIPTTAVLLHEIFHLVTRIMQDRGIPVQAQTDAGIGDEAAACLYDYFTREALRRAGVRVGGRTSFKRAGTQ